MKKATGFIAALMMSIAVNAEEAPRTEMQMSAYQSRLEIALLNYTSGQFEAAFEDLLKFAKTGDKLAQYLTAMAYLQGQGTKMNNMEGYAWLSVAVEQNNKKWKKMLANIDKGLDDEFKDKVKPKVEEYIAKYGIKAQKLVCRNRKETGTQRRRHTCEKIQTRRGFFYVGEDSGLT